MIADIAIRLTNDPGAHIVHAIEGGNSAVHQILSQGKRFALKHYPADKSDLRHRQRTESIALDFLLSHGMANVPRRITSWENYSLFSWLDGTTLTNPTHRDIEHAAELLIKLQGLSNREDAHGIGPAFEACTSLDTFITQLKTRFEDLSEHCSAYPDLLDFLHVNVGLTLDAFQERAYALYDHAALPTTQLPMTEQRIIHGDFGIHNILKHPNGSLQLIDFEYFGWDDPVKMIADFALHPGIALEPHLRGHWLSTINDGISDRRLQQRLNALLPLFAVRWALIALSTLRYAPHDENLKQRQVQKANALLALPANEGLL